jgi:dCMP deaminase
MRPSWDEYFMQLAIYASSRSTCDRLHVGAVIVKDNCVLTTGYNGSITHLPHCNEVGCLIVDNHCVRTIHAEINAIDQAAKYGREIKNASMYVSAFPCWNCFKTIVNSGIIEIVYNESYRPDENVINAVHLLKYKLRKYERVQEKT